LIISCISFSFSSFSFLLPFRRRSVANWNGLMAVDVGVEDEEDEDEDEDEDEGGGAAAAALAPEEEDGLP
jgi:hypothetical protein